MLQDIDQIMTMCLLAMCTSSILNTLSDKSNAIIQIEEGNTIKMVKAEGQCSVYDFTLAGYSPWKFPPEMVSPVSGNTSWR